MMLIILNVLYSLWGTFDDLAYTNIERKGFLSGVFCAGANKNIHTYTHTHTHTKGYKMLCKDPLQNYTPGYPTEVPYM